MKAFKYTLPLLIGFVFFACNNDDDGASPDNPGAQPIATEEVTGNWEVTLFRDDNEDETDDFAGLTFEFQEGGDLIISDGNQSTTARWSITNSNRRVEIDLDDDDLTVFGNRDELEDLDDDWIVVEKSDNLLYLREDDDDSDRDEVRFERI
ncbi:hypothetical protein [Tunicatimonas pelagia]|uniref:hypothetical protein n=1 Tax=Tunicatimonas pelagia TaxID=931531 RepID=UPI002665ACAD|nr:hypothetical protein [Tunicatimonas pelagia]WKN42158.1 hypothetical protein P0M28_24280 [Tunicatimonas pelagia]